MQWEKKYFQVITHTGLPKIKSGRQFYSIYQIFRIREQEFSMENTKKN